MRTPIIILTALLLFAASILGGCQPAAVTPDESGFTEPINLRMALIPVLDALPIHLAQSQGLFEKHGVTVTLIPVKSAPERDQLMASNQADGMVNEVLSTIFFNRESVRVQTVRYAQTATAEAALFRILSAKNSGITDIDGLKGASVGIGEGTVIEYLTDRLLEAEGFTQEEINTVAVPDITTRMSLLNSGELQAAMLPEPLSSLVVAQGASVALDDTSHPEFSFSTISFRKEVIDEHPEVIRAFLAAVEEAVELINKDPAALKDLLAELSLVPVPIQEAFVPNQFVTAGIPTEDQWNDVLEWAKEKGLVSVDVSYSESVTGEYLP